jgi:hypothetical protein
MSWRRRVVFGFAGLFVLILVAGAVLWWLKPWAPEVVLTAPGAPGSRIDSAFGPRLSEGHPDLSDRRSSGTAAANNEARAKSWPLIVDFLRKQLDRSQADEFGEMG